MFRFIRQHKIIILEIVRVVTKSILIKHASSQRRYDISLDSKSLPKLGPGTV